MNNGVTASAAHDPNGALTILASIMLGIAAVAVFPVMPVLVGGLVDKGGLTPSESGLIAATDIIGMSFANVLAFFWVRRWNWRYMAALALGILVTGNLICTQLVHFWPLILARSVVGMAEGTALALTYGIMATSANPDRNYGLFLAGNLSLGAGTVLVLPTLLQRFGSQSVFFTLCFWPLVSLVMLPYVPTPVRGAAHIARTGPTTRPLVITIALTANLVYFMGQSGVWAYFERFAVSRGLPLQDAATGLSISLLLGVLGAATASLLNVRLGRALPLVVAVLAAAVGVLLLGLTNTLLTFAIATSLFNFGNNFGHPYLLGYLAEIDPSGRFVVVSGALQTGGMGLGPMIAALLIAHNSSGKSGYEPVFWLGYVCFGLTLLLFLPIMTFYKSSRDPLVS